MVLRMSIAAEKMLSHFALAAVLILIGSDVQLFSSQNALW